ncbi:MAG: c-type cytochrome [candidate division KSB1 bacterium]|nr:c-type cytochrome [candidate division KSB1 bacterium]MDZ7314416.1 c-type cytochrome [candidate division KSB1 bacterium]
MPRITMRKFLPLLAVSGFVALVVFALALGQTPGGGQVQNPKAMTAESIKAGEAVFFEYCSGCHGRRADGRGLQSLNLNPKPQNLRNAQFVKYLSDERIFTSISGGVRGTAMPAFEMMLTPDRRWDVINYIRSLTADDTLHLPNAIGYQPVPGEAKNPLEKSPENIAKGRKLFMNYCASCHGAAADGKGVIAPNLVPAPRNLVVVTSWGEKPFIDYLSDARLYDSITNGVPGTSMLPWLGVLGDEERWATIVFLRAEADKNREKEVAMGK